MQYNLQNPNADLIIEKGNRTFVMTLCPADADYAENSKPLREQPIWQIQRIETVVDETKGTTETRITYPNGLNGYNFVAEQFEDYTYSYRK